MALGPKPAPRIEPTKGRHRARPNQLSNAPGICWGSYSRKRSEQERTVGISRNDLLDSIEVAVRLGVHIKPPISWPRSRMHPLILSPDARSPSRRNPTLSFHAESLMERARKPRHPLERGARLSPEGYFFIHRPGPQYRARHLRRSLGFAVAMVARDCR